MLSSQADPITLPLYTIVPMTGADFYQFEDELYFYSVSNISTHFFIPGKKEFGPDRGRDCT